MVRIIDPSILEAFQLDGSDFFAVDREGVGGTARKVRASLLGEALPDGSIPKSKISGGLASVGEIIEISGLVPPDGTMVGDGSTLLRTDFPALWEWVATVSGNLAATQAAKQAGQYGPGDGATTFSIPDYRGLFRRGFDDGRGLDPGRVFGTLQQDQNKAHTHSGTAASAGAHTHTGTALSAGGHSHTASTGSDAGGTLVARGQRNAQTRTVTNSAGAHTHNLSINSSGAHTHTLTIDSSGGSEARPVNTTTLVCIRYE